MSINRINAPVIIPTPVPAGAMIHLMTQEVTVAVASVSFTDIVDDTLYSSYVFKVINTNSSGGTDNFLFKFLDNAGSAITTTYQMTAMRGLQGTTTFIGETGNTTSAKLSESGSHSGTVYMYNNLTAGPQITTEFMSSRNGYHSHQVTGCCIYGTASVLGGARFEHSSAANFTSGVFSAYGISK